MRVPLPRIQFLIFSAWLVAVCAERVERPDQKSKRVDAAVRNVRQRPSILLPDGPTDQALPRLHNLMQVSDGIYTGGEPAGDAAFADLVQLGVRTVVSVDGAQPDVETARRHGLRYVHIPIGYDGIDRASGEMLARLVREAQAPFYIHCHHGRHRGPAAAAVACVASDVADGKAALAVLERAGTSENYGGLWNAVESYEPPPADANLPPLVEVAQVDSLAAAMAKIDRARDNLEICQQNAWQTPADHPDIVPCQEALLLREGFRESLRQLEKKHGGGERNANEYAEYDQRFLEWLEESERTAAALEGALSAAAQSTTDARGTDESRTEGATTDKATATQHFSTLRSQCKRCHADYRGLSEARATLVQVYLTP